MTPLGVHHTSSGTNPELVPGSYLSKGTHTPLQSALSRSPGEDARIT